MTLSSDLQAQILRYYHVEKWRMGTIACQLGIHHGSVRRVLAQAGLPPLGAVQRPSQIDLYIPFIHQTLEKFPRLTASRLYAMVRERGYHGGPDHFRHVISYHRPRPAAEAYLRLTTLPGEQGQVDWGHFGHMEIGRARRPLMAFVMVLSYSRQIYLRFFLDARMESFLRGHVGAFEAWSGLHAYSFTTTSKARCWNAKATPFVFIQPCSPLPATTITSLGRWRWRAAMKKAGWSGRSATSATTFLPRGRTPI